MSLFHVFFASQSPELLNEQSHYKKIVSERDSVNNLHVNKFEEDLISKAEYLSLVKSSFIFYKNKLKNSSAKKRKLAEKFSFRGRSSFHFWIFVFGLVTALFFFSCKSLHDDFSRGSTFKFHFVSFTGILVSIFWFTHLIFLTQSDFTQNKYIAAILIIAVLFSIFTYYLVKYYSYKDNLIDKQLSFLERIRVFHYPRIAKKAKYAEKAGLIEKSDLENDIDEFQKDLRKVFNGN
ncbi:hypothetical protein ACSTS3_10745 [Aquimarina muelleri]|uniref:hypothetical protein n=1 Tax=Aquimarina muelleri TaxID=279356 RepID=UPI003F68428B